MDNSLDAFTKIEKLNPGLIILDIGLPSIDGLSIINRMSTQNSPVKIIVLTAQESDHLAIRCMEMGGNVSSTKY
ncbi:response regulator [Pseudomonas arsenicoxydans]|uniref:Response regulator n=1 Tax=Pseudomonas arsenicoxydans TaxID=702115 RepID=A0A502GQ03_9PSED|nr:response regulator [Pseudomonas arsenicoxydans]